MSAAGNGWSDSRIAEALDTSIANIERTRRQLVEEGWKSVLTRKYNPNSARPRIFDGVAEAKLIALTCGPAPAGHAKWSLRLLEEKVVELNIVQRASDNTIGRPRIFDGAAEAKLIALTCGPAPAGHAKWSLRLLEEKVVELNIVQRASDNTIGRTLKKTFSNRISSSNG